MKEITLAGNLLAQLAPFASKQETRYVLNSIKGTVKDGWLELAATDGGSLCVYRKQLENNDNDGLEFLIRNMKPAEFKKKMWKVTEDDNGNKTFQCLDNGATYPLMEEAKSYPKYENVTRKANWKEREKFSMFSSDKIKLLESVGLADGIPFVGTEGQFSAHSWKKEISNESWEVVLMNNK